MLLLFSLCTYSFCVQSKISWNSILNIKGNRIPTTTLLFSTNFAIAGSISSYFSVTSTWMTLLISCYLMKSFHVFHVYVFSRNLILENNSSNQQIFATVIYYQDYTKSIPSWIQLSEPWMRVCCFDGHVANNNLKNNFRVSYEISLILVSHFLGNEWWYVGKKAFSILPKISDKKEKEKKSTIH